MMATYKIDQNMFGRFIVRHPKFNENAWSWFNHLAWSGSRWVDDNGDVQISNFATKEEAVTYANASPLLQKASEGM